MGINVGLYSVLKWLVREGCWQCYNGKEKQHYHLQWYILYIQNAIVYIIYIYVFNLYIIYIHIYIYIYVCLSFYVNKLIKAEAESFLESFFLDYPIYNIIYIYIYIYNIYKYIYIYIYRLKTDYYAIWYIKKPVIISEGQ